MNKIDEIVNGSYKITEKQEMLKKYKEEINHQIADAAAKIVQGYKYCPQCKEYYKEKAWDTEYKTEKRNICTYRDAGYGDDDTYEYKTCFVQYGICPIGHRIEEHMSYK